MTLETEHITGDFAALRWSLGCVFASYHERIYTMTRFNPDASPVLIAIAALVCLGPLTAMWCVAASLMVRTHVTSAAVSLPIALGTLGPVALALILHRIFSGRFTWKILLTILTLGFAILATAQITQLATPWFAIEWRVVALNSILPGVACAYFARLPRRGAATA